MTYNELIGMLNPTHSLTHSFVYWQVQYSRLFNRNVSVWNVFLQDRSETFWEGLALVFVLTVECLGPIWV